MISFAFSHPLVLTYVAGFKSDQFPMDRDTARAVPLHTPVDDASPNDDADPIDDAAPMMHDARAAKSREFWRYDGSPRRRGDGPSGAAGLTVCEQYMGATGGWYEGENRNPRTAVFPRPVPDAVVREPSRALIAQRRRVREQLVTYTAMADALEYMEYQLSTREERKKRRTNPWINLGTEAALVRSGILADQMPADDSRGWDSDRDDHAMPRR